MQSLPFSPTWKYEFLGLPGLDDWEFLSIITLKHSKEFQELNSVKVSRCNSFISSFLPAFIHSGVSTFQEEFGHWSEVLAFHFESQCQDLRSWFSLYFRSFTVSRIRPRSLALAPEGQFAQKANHRQQLFNIIVLALVLISKL